MSDIDLNPLLTGIAAQDVAAFSRFYELTHARVYGMALRILRDPGLSEEATQEVFLAVWRSAPSFDAATGSAVSWLMTLTHHRAVDKVRSESAAKRRTLTYGAADLAGRVDHDTVVEISARHETTREVQSYLDLLTPLQREAIELAYYGGLSYREVADQLGVALPTVKSRIRQGLLRLLPHAQRAAAA